MTWRRVDPFFARRIQLAVFIVGLAFGLDYIFTPDASSPVLTYLERGIVPLWLWGAVIMGASAAGLFTETFILGNDHPLLPTEKRNQWGWVTNIAHITLMAIFIVLTMSTLVDIISRGVNTGQWYAWRTSAMWAGYAYANRQYIRKLGEPL